MTKMVTNNIKQKKWPGGTGGKEGKLGGGGGGVL